MGFARAFQKPQPVCCAITRCRVEMTPGKVMCFEHWSMVPKALQREIGHLYRARQMNNYQAALSRAVDYIETENGLFIGVFEKRPVRDTVRVEGGGSPPVTPPSRPIVRRPRLTLKRLYAIQEALAFRLSGELGDEAESQSAYDGADAWVAGEIAKRQMRINGVRA